MGNETKVEELTEAPKGPQGSVVANKGMSYRRNLQEKLDREHPEYIHTFVSAGRSQGELEYANLELVRENTYGEGKGTKVRMVKRDRLARIRKDVEMAKRVAQEEASYDIASKSVTPDETKSGSVWVDDSGKNGKKVKPNKVIGRKVPKSKRTK